MEKQDAFCAGCPFWRDLIHCTFDAGPKNWSVKPRANGRNIVGQQLPTSLRPFAHRVGCCFVLLRKVWNRSKFWTNNSRPSFVPWSPMRSASMLDPFAQLFQHCGGHACALHMVSNVLWVVSFSRCPVGPNIVGSYCIRLHTTANTGATILIIVDPTMLGVVASICT